MAETNTPESKVSEFKCGVCLEVLVKENEGFRCPKCNQVYISGFVYTDRQKPKEVEVHHHHGSDIYTGGIEGGF